MKKLIEIVVLWVVVVGAVGCKQGRGERCQVDEDCAEGNCSQSEPKVCGGDNSSQLDASFPIDAPPKMDAPVDVPPI